MNNHVPDITYILPRGSSKTYTFLKNFFVVGCIWNRYIKEKYYKGIESILYFPYINHDLKVCPKVKIPFYYGLKCDKIIFDDFITADGIFDQIARCKNNYSKFDYEAHKEIIEEHNKNLHDPRLFGEYILDNSPIPDWAKEHDPSLSGKLNGITVKNW